MRSRAWMFCSARFSAPVPPSACQWGLALLSTCERQTAKNSRGFKKNQVRTRKRGVQPTMLESRDAMALTTASIFTSRWSAPICSAAEALLRLLWESRLGLEQQCHK